VACQVLQPASHVQQMAEQQLLTYRVIQQVVGQELLTYSQALYDLRPYKSSTAAGAREEESFGWGGKGQRLDPVLCPARSITCAARLTCLPHNMFDAWVWSRLGLLA
jgi:hypothetical protein